MNGNVDFGSSMNVLMNNKPEKAVRSSRRQGDTSSDLILYKGKENMQEVRRVAPDISRLEKKKKKKQSLVRSDLTTEFVG